MPKWHAHTHQGKYLGVSPGHSSTIGHILNLRSSFISPQYHVIYDDLFSTVPNAESGGMLKPELDGPFWHKLIATGYKSLLPDDDDDPIPVLHPGWLTDAELCAYQCDHTPARSHPSLPLPVPFPSVPPSVAKGTLDQPSHPPQQQPHPNRSASFAPEGVTPPPAQEGANDDMEIIFADDPEPGSHDTADNDHDYLFVLLDPDRYGHGKRCKKLNRHLFDERLWMTYSCFQRGSCHLKQKVQQEQLNAQLIPPIPKMEHCHLTDAIRSVDQRNMENILLQHTDPYNRTVKEMHPFALATKADAADNPNWEQAMNGPHSAG